MSTSTSATLPQPAMKRTKSVAPPSPQTTGGALPPPGAPLTYWTTDDFARMEEAYRKFYPKLMDRSNDEFLYPLLDEGVPGLLKHFASPFKAMLGLIMSHIDLDRHERGAPSAAPDAKYWEERAESPWSLARAVYQHIAREPGVDMAALMTGRASTKVLTEKVAGAYHALTVSLEDKKILLAEQVYAIARALERQMTEIAAEGIRTMVVQKPNYRYSYDEVVLWGISRPDAPTDEMRKALNSTTDDPQLLVNDAVEAVHKALSVPRFLCEMHFLVEGKKGRGATVTPVNPSPVGSVLGGDRDTMHAQACALLRDDIAAAFALGPDALDVPAGVLGTVRLTLRKCQWEVQSSTDASLPDAVQDKREAVAQAAQAAFRDVESMLGEWLRKPSDAKEAVTVDIHLSASGAVSSCTVQVACVDAMDVLLGRTEDGEHLVDVQMEITRRASRAYANNQAARERKRKAGEA